MSRTMSWFTLSIETVSSPLTRSSFSTAPLPHGSVAPFRMQPLAVACCIASTILSLPPPKLLLRDFLRGGAAPSSPDESPFEARLIFKVRRDQSLLYPACIPRFLGFAKPNYANISALISFICVASL